MYNHNNCKRACCSEDTRKNIINSLSYRKLPILEYKCLSCGEIFKKKLNRRGRGNLFCSKKCLYSYGGRRGITLSQESRKKLSKKYMGAGSPTWKGGISKDKEWIKVRQKNIRNKKRKEVVDFLGGKCTCCGETEYKFLAIDHINNDGARHRRDNFSAKSHLHQVVINDGLEKAKLKYQILCHNCNFAKSHWKGCPHNNS